MQREGTIRCLVCKMLSNIAYMSVLHHCTLHQWLPAISHLSPREARGFAERFIAVDNGVVHNLSVGKDEAGVG